jgi:hypothetical protein
MIALLGVHDGNLRGQMADQPINAFRKGGHERVLGAWGISIRCGRGHPCLGR